MSQRLILGLAGPSGSGKTRIGVALFPLEFLSLSFNATIRNMVRGLIPFSSGKLTCHIYRETPNELLDNQTPAAILASLETWLAENFPPDFIERKLAQTFAANPATNFMVDDIHTDRQANFIKSQGGLILGVDPDLPDTPTDFGIDPGLLDEVLIHGRDFSETFYRLEHLILRLLRHSKCDPNPTQPKNPT